jgi:hypothetical protein
VQTEVLEVKHKTVCTKTANLYRSTDTRIVLLWIQMITLLVIKKRIPINDFSRVVDLYVHLLHKPLFIKVKLERHEGYLSTVMCPFVLNAGIAEGQNMD